MCIRDRFYIPYKGIAIGLGANVFAHLFNFQYSFRIGFLILPALVEYAWVWTGSAPYVRSLDFLNWLVEYRRAKAEIETDGGALYRRNPLVFQKYTKQIGSKSVYELYDELVTLVSSESASNE
eukprot:TRINITY_DN305_c0_g3_i5.p1 TRINITY_DN305_c0_g3~~TRINITY_DN305_c0_g3_i5.p1  ORF type:complete len:123 (+),score=35.95 TRINITY_DN305_c0_g3_i5:66-434(+)